MILKIKMLFVLGFNKFVESEEQVVIFLRSKQTKNQEDKKADEKNPGEKGSPPGSYCHLVVCSFF